jgi:hypothetical protein
VRYQSSAPRVAPGDDPARPSAASTRRVVVEAKGWDMRARQRTARTTAQSPGRYLLALERLAGSPKDDAPGPLYGPEGPLQRERFLRHIAEEGRQMSVLLVPLDGRALDLSAYVRRVMAGAERNIGRQLEWAAVNHTDAVWAHAHVVLRGVSRAGHVLPAPIELAGVIRQHAEQVGPEGLGLEDSGLARRWDEIFAAVFTPWDFRLAELSTGNSVPFAAFSGDGNLETRVEGLEMMDLARMYLPEGAELSQSSWLLVKGWLELLLDWGVEHDTQDTGDQASAFAAARNVVPWRATAGRGPITDKPARGG